MSEKENRCALDQGSDPGRLRKCPNRQKSRYLRAALTRAHGRPATLVRQAPRPTSRRSNPNPARPISTSSSSARASPASGLPITCSATARKSPSSSWRGARHWAAPGTCSAIPASAPIPTCTRSAIASAPGAVKRRSPTVRRSSSTCATRRPKPESTARSVSTHGSLRRNGRRTMRVGASRQRASTRANTSR